MLPRADVDARELVKPYRGENRGLVDRKLKNMGKRAYDGLRN